MKPFFVAKCWGHQDKVQKIKNLKQQIAAVHSETGKLKEVPILVLGEAVWMMQEIHMCSVVIVAYIVMIRHQKCHKNQVFEAYLVAGRG